MRISRDGSRDRYIELVSDAELDKLIFIGTVEWEKNEEIWLNLGLVPFFRICQFVFIGFILNTFIFK